MSKPVLLVTGGAKGIGAAICRHFSALGYDILVNYHRSGEAAENLAKQLSEETHAVCFRADVGSMDEVDALFAFCGMKFRRLDVLVNNASYSSSTSWKVNVDEIDWNEWQRTIDVDLKGTMLCCHAAYRLMSPKGSGR